MNNREFFPFKRLPKEIQTYIFSFLNPKDLCTLEEVDRETKALASSDYVWKSLAATRHKKKQHYRRNANKFLYTMVLFAKNNDLNYRLFSQNRHQFDPQQMADALKKSSTLYRWFPKLWEVKNEIFSSENEAVIRFEKLSSQLSSHNILNTFVPMLMKYKEEKNDKIRVIAFIPGENKKFITLAESVIYERSDFKSHTSFHDPVKYLPKAEVKNKVSTTAPIEKIDAPQNELDESQIHSNDENESELSATIENVESIAPSSQTKSNKKDEESDNNQNLKPFNQHQPKKMGFFEGVQAAAKFLFTSTPSNNSPQYLQRK